MHNNYLQLAQYHIWATKKLEPVLTDLTEAQWNTKLVSSFETIALTVAHTASADDIWSQRCNHAENLQWQFNTIDKSQNILIPFWIHAASNFSELIIKNINQLETELAYSDLKQNSYKSSLATIFYHVVNHGTFHRGQIITMLRQVGLTSLPSTDFITFTRQ